MSGLSGSRFNTWSHSWRGYSSLECFNQVSKSCCGTWSESRTVHPGSYESRTVHSGLASCGRTCPGCPGLASTRGRILDGGMVTWSASTKSLSLVVGLDLNHGWYIRLLWVTDGSFGSLFTWSHISGPGRWSHCWWWPWKSEPAHECVTTHLPLSLVVGLDLNHGRYIRAPMSHGRFIRVSLHVVAHVRSGSRYNTWSHSWRGDGNLECFNQVSKSCCGTWSESRMVHPGSYESRSVHLGLAWRGRTCPGCPGLASTRGRILDGGMVTWSASTKSLSLVVGLDLNHGWYIRAPMSHGRFIRVSLHVVAHIRVQVGGRIADGGHGSRNPLMSV